MPPGIDDAVVMLRGAALWPGRRMLALGGALGDAALDRTLDRLERADLPQRIAERVVESASLRGAVSTALESPGAERLVTVALESPGLERMVTRIVESRVVDNAVARVVEELIERLPQTEAMWSFVEEVAGSPAVTEAIARQGTSFADHVGDEVRDRSRTADATLERAARRVLLRRRRPMTGPPAPAGGTP